MVHRAEKGKGCPMLMTVLKVVGSALALLGLAGLSAVADQRDRQRKEEDDRIAAGLDDLAYSHYGKPFSELDSEQQQVVRLELQIRW